MEKLWSWEELTTNYISAQGVESFLKNLTDSVAESLQQKVTTLANSVTRDGIYLAEVSKRDEINDLKAKIAQLEGENSQLKTKLQNAEDNTKVLTERVSLFRKHRNEAWDELNKQDEVIKALNNPSEELKKALEQARAEIDRLSTQYKASLAQISHLEANPYWQAIANARYDKMLLIAKERDNARDDAAAKSAKYMAVATDLAELRKAYDSRTAYVTKLEGELSNARKGTETNQNIAKLIRIWKELQNFPNRCPSCGSKLACNILKNEKKALDEDLNKILTLVCK
jgi:DNA repair exonuclease SbcCD ATPase subunit